MLETLKPFYGIEEYGYGKLPDVITSSEFEKMLLHGKIQTKEGKKPNNIVIIHCVGSRNKNYHEYCSRTCCMTALKYSNQVRFNHHAKTLCS
jgi:heterodisulfide reductase subunit A